MSDRPRHFASDNYAGICPQAWQAMADANRDHTPAYGDDPWTQQAADLIRQRFDTDCDVFFVFNGTAANSLSLAALFQSYHSVICHETAHIETDECGAPEFFSNGTKLLLVPGADGRLDVRGVERTITKRQDIHYPRPRVLTLTQATELGTVYSPDQIRELSQLAKLHGLHVHMDGARFANAVASLGVEPAAVTWQAGVEVLSFGATKNGSGVGEAVVFFNRELAKEFDYRCKQAGQLASKMRFLSAPWVGMLREDIWLQNAKHANAMAATLAERVSALPGVKLLFPRQANAVFVELPPPAIEALRSRGWRFYTFIGQGGCRFMCSWDTTPKDVEALVKDIAITLGTAR